MWANKYPESTAAARRPLLACTAETKKHVEEECADIVAVERSLEKEGYVGLGLKNPAEVAAKVNGTKKPNGLLETVKQKVAAL